MPWESRDVSWQVEGMTMDGTLARPAGAGPWPGVVFVAGSGPTDRDWNSPLLPGANGQADGPLEAAAKGRPNIAFVYPPDANHIMKHEARPRAELDPAVVTAGYNAPETALDPLALAAIRDWLVARRALKGSE